MAATPFPYTSSGREIKQPDHYTEPSAPLKAQSKRVKRQKTSVSVALQNKFLNLIKKVNSANPVLPESKRKALADLVRVGKQMWLDEIEDTTPIELRCEAALLLAQHYFHSEAEEAFDHAVPYYETAVDRWGKGKYDIRSDAARHAAAFYEKNPTVANLKQAARYYTLAAKAAYYYSEETAKASSFSSAANVYRNLAQLAAEEGATEKAQKYLKKAEKCDDRAKINLAEKKEISSIGNVPIRRRIQQKMNADRLYSESKELCHEAKKSGSLSQEEVLKAEALLSNEKSKWFDQDPIQCQKNLKARSRLSLLIALHYRDVEPEKASSYYQMALEKFSIGKYDVNGRAYESYAHFIVNRAGPLSEENVKLYEDAAKCFAIAAKATYIYSTETKEHSSYTDAAEIHFKLHLIFKSVGNSEKSETHRLEAIKYSKNALRIKGPLTADKLNNLKQGILVDKQTRAVAVLENCSKQALGQSISSIVFSDESAILSDHELQESSTPRAHVGKRNRTITDD